MVEVAAPLLDAPPLRRQSPPQLVVAAAPAAGADFAQSVNDGLWWRLASVYVRLVTSADAADREVGIEYRDPEGNVYSADGAPVEQTADTTTDYHFSAFRSQDKWPVSSRVLTTLTPLILPPTHSLNIVVANIDNTDALSRIRYVVEKFYIPPASDFPAFA